MARSSGRIHWAFPETKLAKLGPLPETRLEISPAEPALEDYFLNLLTATDSTADVVPRAQVRIVGNAIRVSLEETKIIFYKDKVDGSIEISGKKTFFGGKLTLK